MVLGIKEARGIIDRCHARQQKGKHFLPKYSKTDLQEKHDAITLYNWQVRAESEKTGNSSFKEIYRLLDRYLIIWRMHKNRCEPVDSIIKRCAQRKIFQNKSLPVFHEFPTNPDEVQENKDYMFLFNIRKFTQETKYEDVFSRLDIHLVGWRELPPPYVFYPLVDVTEIPDICMSFDQAHQHFVENFVDSK